MKRIGYLFEKVCDYENLDRALTEACKGKHLNGWVRWILENRKLYLTELREKLLSGKWKASKNRIKIIIEAASGKERRLEIPAFFPDRVVHWAVCLVLNPLFLKGMYRYCVGSVPNRGTSDGRKFVRRVLRRDKKIKYVMQLDLKKYFQSVSHGKVKELLRRKIKDKKLLTLLDLIVDAGTEGLPIGYYTSQWLANFYLERFDHYLKENLAVRYYVRNVDDMLFLDTNKRKLHKVLKALNVFLFENGFNVRVKDNWQIWKIGSRPIDFLGIMIYDDHIYMRKRNFYRFGRRLLRTRRKGYCTVRTARGIMSGLGEIRHLPHGRNFYLKYIKPIISKGECRKIISLADRRKAKGV